MAKQQQAATEQKRKSALLVSSFLNKAKTLGINPDRWAFYNIDIKKPVFFHEMVQILNQCENSSFFYFKPAFIHAKLASANSRITKSDTGDKAAFISESSSDDRQKDVLLELKGVFVVRQNER